MKMQSKTASFRTLAFVTLFAATAILANEENPKSHPMAPIEKKANELSVRYSNLTGYGVGYQRNFLTNYYVRTTAWFKYYEYIKGKEGTIPWTKKSDKNYNFGLDLQRNIIAENQYRVFGFIGGGYGVREKTIRENLVIDPDNLTQTLITAGLGGGIEYFFSKNLSTDLGVSYKFDYDVKDKLIPESTKETGLGMAIGLNLNF